MIALNEILANKDVFVSKYKLMRKKYNLDKIIAIEEKFIAIDKEKNKLRADCNKLCSEIAFFINANKNTNEQLKKINEINKTIFKLENKSKQSMNKINKRLKKLPNLPLETNELNISKTTNNLPCLKDDFINFLKQKFSNNIVLASNKNYIKSLRKNVLKVDELPKLIEEKSSRSFLILGSNDTLELFNDLQEFLTNNSHHILIKSIKCLKKDCSKEIIATLLDNILVSIEYLDEYVSREKLIKFYDPNVDMTKFVNIIRISFCNNCNKKAKD